MPNDLPSVVRPWTRFLSNHNPLYLVSAWLVLHGIGQAFQGEVGLRWIPLMTQLLCGYTLVLALAGWLVVRVGRVWEDARMILLVVLLMFTALSTSYDNLCLKNPAIGAVHLAIGFGFSCAITEFILFSLGMKLPLHYRAPFYLQLALLFAFPAWLGRLSVYGQDSAMCAGVLSFPVAAAAGLMTLLPAAAGTPEQENGTPWPWPFYPWSIFVFVAIASGIRAWMLSVSFSPAIGVEPAFLPYFLCPVLIAMLILVLEMGLQQKSHPTQRIALLAMLGVIWMAFPGNQLNTRNSFCSTSWRIRSLDHPFSCAARSRPSPSMRCSDGQPEANSSRSLRSAYLPASTFTPAAREALELQTFWFCSRWPCGKSILACGPETCCAWRLVAPSF